MRLSGIGLSPSPALLVSVGMFGGLGILGFGCGEKCRAPGEGDKGMRSSRFRGMSLHSSPAGPEGLVWSLSRERGGGNFTEVQGADVMQPGGLRTGSHMHSLTSHICTHTAHHTHTPHAPRASHVHTTHIHHILHTHHTYHTTHTHPYTHSKLLPPTPPRTQLCLLRALGHRQQG